MKRRQRVPEAWLVVDGRLDPRLRRVIRTLPAGTGLLVLCRDLPKRERARLLGDLRRIASARALIVADELAGQGARVHGAQEIRRAGLAGAPLLFLSPLYPTRSHPEWRPLPRMRAAALARLAKAPVIALGGMDSKRFARLRGLGFAGWAGIDAWRIRT